MSDASYQLSALNYKRAGNRRFGYSACWCASPRSVVMIADHVSGREWEVYNVAGLNRSATPRWRVREALFGNRAVLRHWGGENQPIEFATLLGAIRTSVRGAQNLTSS